MKRLVIIGGGFAGSYLAKKLEKKFSVTLIDKNDYFEFTPGILRCIVDADHIDRLQIKHKEYLKRSKIVVGDVKEVSYDYVMVSGKKIKFDYLAVCSGSKYEAPIKDEDLAMAGRAHELISFNKKVKDARSVLIIGGGLVGVELAGEIVTKYKDKKITVFNLKDRLVDRNTHKVSKYIENYLRKKGVKFVFEDKVMSFSKKMAISEKNVHMPADIAFYCTGIRPNYTFMQKNFHKSIDARGYLQVDEHLRLKGRQNIFCCGDITGINEEKTAQNAINQAKIVKENLRSLLKEKKLKRYKSKSTILVISLGKFNGVITYRKFHMAGIIPAFLKYLVERYEMIRLRYG